MTRRAARYRRISQDREGRELGIERQGQDLDVLAERRSLVWADDYVDNDISASTKSKKRRPEYERMLADAKAGKFEVIAAYTTSRLTRRPREFEDLIDLAVEHGIEFYYVRSPEFDLTTSQGRRVARMMASHDAGQAEDTQELVARQKLQSAMNGTWKGGRRPYGYEADGVTVRASEAAEVLRASRAVVSGSSLRGLTASLNARGIPTSTGRRWDDTALRRVLARPRNAGLMVHRKKIVGKAEWPAIVPESLWRRVAAILGNPDRRTQTTSSRQWLGSGLYTCYCGETVRGDRNSSGDATTRSSRPYYYCRASKHLTRIAVEVDNLVGEFVVERLSRPDAIDLLREDSGEDPADAMARAAELRVRLNDLAELYAANSIDAGQLATASGLMRRQVADLDAKVAKVTRASALAGLAGEPDVAARWAALDIDRKRAVINRLFTVELWAANKGRPPGWKPGESYFDPTTVKIRPKQ